MLGYFLGIAMPLVFLPILQANRHARMLAVLPLAIAPLAIGTVGVGSKNATWQLLVSLVVVAGLLSVISYTSVLRDANETASTAWEATTLGAHAITAEGSGSNVDFADEGNPASVLPLKLLYTLFAPFPWMGGSFALQIGNVEALIWYFMAYRASLAGRRLWRENRALLLMFLSFLVPTTVMYALVTVNVGLTLRERMGIVSIGYLLAMLSWVPATASAKADQPAPPRAPWGRPPRTRLFIPPRCSAEGVMA